MKETETVNLLIIDDEKGICETLCDIFRSGGYIAEAAYNGKSGIAAVENKSFNAVLLDIKLPDMNGIKVLEEIKKISPETEVIMITAYASLQNAVEALNKGAYAYIMKPFEVNEVLSSVKRVVEKQQLFYENKRLKEFNENIVQSMDEGIIIVDPSGSITFINPAVERKLGYSKDELIGENWKKIVPQEFIREIEEKMLAAARERVVKHEGVLLTKIHTMLSVVLSIVPFFEKDEYKGLLLVFTDISEKEKVERELRVKLAEIEKLNRFMIGRELTMVELKRRIKELEEELEMAKGKL